MANEENIVRLDDEMRAQVIQERAKFGPRTETHRPMEKRLLQREMPQARPFPLEALMSLMVVVQAVAAKVWCPVEIVVQSVFSGVNYAVQAHGDIDYGLGRRPISMYFVASGDSGERKTTVDRLVFAPISEYERKLAREIPQAHEGEEQLKPTVCITDPTAEGLIDHLQHSIGSCCIVNDDAGNFFGGYAMGKDQALNTLSKLSVAWDGRPIVSARVGKNTRIARDKRLSLSLMAQPLVIARILNSELARGQGFLSRTCVSEPPSMIGSRVGSMRTAHTPEGDTVLHEFYARLREILGEPLPIIEGTRNDLDPRILRLTKESRLAIEEFYDATEVQCGKDGRLRPVKDFASKAPEHALRIAATLALYDDLATPHLFLRYVKAGIELAGWYMEEQLRLSASGTDPDLFQAQMLLEWLQLRGSRPVAITECYQRGPNQLRTAAKARQMLEILADHNWVEQIPGPVEIDGKMHREVYRLL